MNQPVQLTVEERAIILCALREYRMEHKRFTCPNDETLQTIAMTEVVIEKIQQVNGAW